MAILRQDRAYTFFMPLVDCINPNTFVINPTITGDDFTISKEGNAFLPLATVPMVEPVGSSQVRIDLSATEMGASKITIHGHDVAGKEWQDVIVFLDVPTGNVETVLDIQEGDHVESRNSLVINKRGTTTPVLDKSITGSLLSESITLRTKDATL